MTKRTGRQEMLAILRQLLYGRKTLSFNLSQVSILTVDGYAFKDLNKNGSLIL